MLYFRLLLESYLKILRFQTELAFFLSKPYGWKRALIDAKQHKELRILSILHLVY